MLTHRSTHDEPTRSAERGIGRTKKGAVAAFSAAAVLALSSCGALFAPAGGPGKGDQPTAPAAQAAAKEVAALKGKKSSAAGTEGMAPFGEMSKVGPSAAVGLPKDPASDVAYKKFYGQKISWGKCDNPAYAKAQCATINVPLKWNDPAGPTIELLLTKLSASKQAKGSLVVNPGGPGGSGAQLAAEYGPMMFPEELRANYDIVGFDPRGVKDSSGIKCLDDKQTDQYLSLDASTETDEGNAEWEKWSKKISEACKSNSGNILPYLDTYSVARDMDVIRALVGSDKLDYLGYSYGTYLGASYAELYPSRVGKFVLDGALDPSLTGDEIAAGQAEGFENAARRFVSWCQSTRKDCPLTGDVNSGMKQLQDFLKAAEKKPLNTSSGRKVTGAMASGGVLMTLYGNENWPLLVDGLASGMKGDGDMLLMLNDLANERNPDGTFESNGMYAITAVNCLDHPAVSDDKWVEAESKRLASKYPTFGGQLGGSGTMCAGWPAKVTRAPKPANVKGTGTVIVIGTKNDPATPYPWAESLAKQFENSALITYNGDGHTAYGRSGGCVEDIVNAYLIDGKEPQKTATCEAPAS